MRILVVEDEYLIAAEIANILADAGHTIIGLAASAEQAINKLTQEPGCDLAVLDANLAGSSTSPVAAALRRRSIPFIVISGYSQRELIQPLRNAPFVPKPVRAADLLAMVAAATRDCGKLIA